MGRGTGDDDDKKDKKKDKDKDKDKEGEGEGEPEESESEESEEDIAPPDPARQSKRQFQILIKEIKLTNKSSKRFDPYVKFIVGAERPRRNETEKETRKRESVGMKLRTKSTKSLQKNQSHYYKEVFARKWRGSAEDLESSDCILQVWDWDRWPNKDDLEGHLKIPMDKLAYGSVRNMWIIKDTRNKLLCTVECLFYFQEIRRFELKLDQWQGKRLRSTERKGGVDSADPYLEIRFEGMGHKLTHTARKVKAAKDQKNKDAAAKEKEKEKEKQLKMKGGPPKSMKMVRAQRGKIVKRAVHSGVAHNTLFPVWDELCGFSHTLIYHGTMFQLNNEVLMIKAYDKDIGIDDLIGWARVPIRGLFGAADGLGRISTELRYLPSGIVAKLGLKNHKPTFAGQVDGSVTLVNKSDFFQFGDIIRSAEPGLQYLVVKIDEATNIRVTTLKKGEKPAVFFTARWGVLSQRTRIIHGGADPEINAVLFFPLNLVEINKQAVSQIGAVEISCTLYSGDGDDNQFLGKSDVELYNVTLSKYDENHDSRTFSDMLQLRQPGLASETFVAVQIYFKPDLKEPDGSSVIFDKPDKEKSVLTKHFYERERKWRKDIYHVLPQVVSQGFKYKCTAVDPDLRTHFLPEYLLPTKPPEPKIPDGDEDKWRRDEKSYFKFAFPNTILRMVQVIPWTSDREVFQAGAQTTSELSEDIWVPPNTFLTYRKGDSEDHAILLCNMFMGLKGDYFYDAYVCQGRTRRNQDHVWVLTREYNGDVKMWETSLGKVYTMKNRWKGSTTKYVDETTEENMTVKEKQEAKTKEKEARAAANKRRARLRKLMRKKGGADEDDELDEEDFLEMERMAQEDAEAAAKKREIELEEAKKEQERRERKERKRRQKKHKKGDKRDRDKDEHKKEDEKSENNEERDLRRTYQPGSTEKGAPLLKEDKLQRRRELMIQKKLLLAELKREKLGMQVLNRDEEEMVIFPEEDPEEEDVDELDYRAFGEGEGLLEDEMILSGWRAAVRAKEKKKVRKTQQVNIVGEGLPYRSLEIVFNNKNVWANIENTYPGVIKYDLDDPQSWRPFVTDEMQASKVQRMHIKPFYLQQPINTVLRPPAVVEKQRADIVKEIQDNFIRYRNKKHLPTVFNDDNWPITKHIVEILKLLELRNVVPEDKRQRIEFRLENAIGRVEKSLEKGYRLNMLPISFSSQGHAIISNHIMQKYKFHVMDQKGLRFVLAAHLTSYPNSGMSVWIALGTIQPGEEGNALSDEEGVVQGDEDEKKMGVFDDVIVPEQ